MIKTPVWTATAQLAAAPTEPTGGIVGWVTTVMETLGGPGVGLAVALENLFPPVPSEVLLPLAGFTASQGDLSLTGAIAWSTLGSLVGAAVLYAVGALFGRERTRAVAAWLPLIKVSDIDRTEAWFTKHGKKAVFFGRMVPLFRSFISIPAGIERMSILAFLIFTALGSMVWNAGLIVAGYLLGESWWIVERYAGIVSTAVVVIVGLAVAYFVVSRLVSARRERRARRLRSFRGRCLEAHHGGRATTALWPARSRPRTAAPATGRADARLRAVSAGS